ncbi:MAG: thiamine pyrophosphate-dependent enzyme [Negativicutes bacterium]|nr:thiamine pyrophosphate-dependent enzyme [Negativicutes bacterium]
MEKKFMLGNEAIARGAVEAGVKVVAGYPGTPATEIVDHCAQFPGVYAEWSANEKHAFEVAAGASLTNRRSMAVMKHNGTNAAADFLMHINFTGVRAGMVLISADDPGGLSSQCEEDTRILINSYAHLPVFDPSSVQEAYAMTKAAFALSEQTELVFALRPVMRINHAGGMVEYEATVPGDRSPEFVTDRKRFVMSAVVEKESGGELRPKMRHRWLNGKQAELKAVMEQSPFNWIEPGEGDTGFIGCGIGYAFLKEAEQIHGAKLPILKLSTLPLPEQKVLSFVKGLKKVVVFEEIEPVVENLIKKMCFENKIVLEVLGRGNYLPQEGELTANLVLNAIRSALADKPYEAAPQGKYIPARTRTQCSGCSHRGLLIALKDVVRKNGGIVTGDIGCHDAGTFEPMNLQSTIFCMGSSIPMAYGIKAAGFAKPVYALIGDSTFFHNGLTGLASAIYNAADITVIIAYNSTTAMTGFQPHPGSSSNLNSRINPMDPGAVCEAMGAKVFRCNPYSVEETIAVITEATAAKGVKVVIAEALCYLKFGRDGQISYVPKQVKVDAESCNGCSVCVRTFGCPAITIINNKAVIEESACNGCGVCVFVCKRGAIK